MKRQRCGNEEEVPAFSLCDSEKDWWELNPPCWPLSSIRDQVSLNNNAPFFTLKEHDRYSIDGSQVALLTVDSAAQNFGRGQAAISKGAHLLQETSTERKTKLKNVGGTQKRSSSLSSKQQQRYLQLQDQQNKARISGFPLPLALSSDENVEFEALRKLVWNEQIEFLKVMEDNAVKCNKKRFTTISEDLNQHAQNLFDYRISQAKKRYPFKYKTVMEIDLLGMAMEEDHIPKQVKEVASTGLDRKLSINDTKHRELDVPRLLLLEESLHEGEVPVVSQDQHILRLMQEHKANVAMSSSTLRTMYANMPPHYRSEWSIPAVIRNKGSSVKQVFFDKPLVANEISSRKRYHKVFSKLVRREFSDYKAPCIDAKTKTEVRESGSVCSYKYVLWQIGEFRIIVRCKMHGVCDNSVDRKCIHTHIDYRTNAISEAMGEEEIAKLWLHTWIRGNSSLFLASVEPLKAKIIEAAEISLEALLGKGKTYIDTLLYFNILHGFIRTILDLPKGNLLIKHTAKSPNLMVYHHIDNKVETTRSHEESILDLVAHLENAGSMSPGIDFRLPIWKPLKDRIPYTFEPVSYCLSFYQTGVCTNLDSGEDCIGIHFRQSTIQPKDFEVYKAVDGKLVYASKKNSGHYCVNFAHQKCRIKKCEYPHVSLKQVLQEFAAAEQTEI